MDARVGGERTADRAARGGTGVQTLEAPREAPDAAPKTSPVDQLDGLCRKIVVDVLSPVAFITAVSFASDVLPTPPISALNTGPAPKLLQPRPIELGGLLHGQVMIPPCPESRNR